MSPTFPITLQRTHAGWQLLVHGEPFVLLGGEVHNSSSSSLEYMEEVYRRAAALNCNGLFVPLTWELTEPEEGALDFTLLDGLLAGARRHNLKLGLLWFGAYKNGSSSYAPEWVKRDATRFPRALLANGQVTGTLCPFNAELARADARTFAALCRHLRECDLEGTVVLLQVQNEVGLLGSPRDHSPAAHEAYASPVPAALVTYLQTHPAQLQPHLRSAWEANGQRANGTWAEVFGASTETDEIFMAWGLASYCEVVAAAGAAEYPLPMMANAWLNRPGYAPGQYPSGGPIIRVTDIWRAAAPTIQILAPDIYFDDFELICREFARADNPLLIPEALRGEMAAANTYLVIGEFGAVGFGPFGIESMGGPDHRIEGQAAPEAFNVLNADGRRLAGTYATLDNLLPLLREVRERASEPRRVRGFAQSLLYGQGPLDFGDYRLHIRWNQPYTDKRTQVPGGGLVVRLSEHEFLFAGFGYDALFEPRDPTLQYEYLCVEEGTWSGSWHPRRRLNGDEYAIRLETGDADAVQYLRRVRVHTIPRFHPRTS